MNCLMDHIVLNVEDDNSMVAFYTNILQFETERLAEYRRGEVPFPSVRLNADTVIDLFPKKMWNGNAPAKEGRPHLNHFCFALTQKEWDALRGRLDDHGVTVEEGPVERWGAHGTGISIYFRDPEGNRIEARYYEAGDQQGKCLLSS